MLFGVSGKRCNALIKLKKLPPPHTLVKNYTKWTNQLKAIRSKKRMSKKNRARLESNARNKYRKESIVSLLVKESHGKCAYCEFSIRGGLAERVEHVIPWSKSAENAYKWENLLLICELCNSHKKDYYNPKAPLLNPIRHDPSLFLAFIGEVVHPLKTRGLAKQTIDRMKLNRPALIESRLKKLKDLDSLVKDLKGLGLNKAKILSMGHVSSTYLDPTNAYSACSKAHLNKLL